ncbi:MAG: TetR/AcrR family transcriptional regulator [Thermomicrobiales bacterium]
MSTISDDSTAPSRARQRILDTAQELFYQRGFRAVGVDEIIARSGVAKATLYTHFGSKDRLIAAYLQRQSDNFRGFVESESMAMEKEPGARLDRILQTIERGCANPSFRGCPFINFAVEFPDTSAPGWAVCQTHRAWLRDFVAGLIREGGVQKPELLAEQWCLLYDSAMVGSMFDGGHSAQVAREMARRLVSASLPAASCAAGS